MNSSIANKLVIGTAQFGLDYGIANQNGRVASDEAAKILSAAHVAGINTLDTAISYGDSEVVLGRLGVYNWHVISKLPKVPDNVTNIDAWVNAQLASSLARLNLSRLHGLLLHQPHQLLSPRGPELVRALQRAKANGKVERIGVSIYTPSELLDYLKCLDIDLVQCPLNILDRRLVDSGWAQQLQSQGTEIHIRSAFLQGLLLFPKCERPPKFARWNLLWNTWHDWLQTHQLAAIEACLRYAVNAPHVDKVVIGVDGLHHLRQILSLSTAPLPDLPDIDGLFDDTLINPSFWEQL